MEAEERYKKYRRYIYNARQDMSKVAPSPIRLRMACRVFFQPIGPIKHRLILSPCVPSCLVLQAFTPRGMGLDIKVGLTPSFPFFMTR